MQGIQPVDQKQSTYIINNVVMLVFIAFSQMSTHMPGFQYLFLLGFLHHFVLATLLTSSVRVKLKGTLHLPEQFKGSLKLSTSGLSLRLSNVDAGGSFGEVRCLDPYQFEMYSMCSGITRGRQLLEKLLKQTTFNPYMLLVANWTNTKRFKKP